MLAGVQLVRAGREPESKASGAPSLSSLELGLAGVARREWEEGERMKG